MVSELNQTGYQNFSAHLASEYHNFKVQRNMVSELLCNRTGYQNFSAHLASGYHNCKVQVSELLCQGIRTCQLTSPVGSQLQGSGIRTSLPRYQNFSAHLQWVSQLQGSTGTWSLQPNGYQNLSVGNNTVTELLSHFNGTGVSELLSES